MIEVKGFLSIKNVINISTKIMNDINKELNQDITNNRDRSCIV